MNELLRIPNLDIFNYDIDLMIQYTKNRPYVFESELALTRNHKYSIDTTKTTTLGRLKEVRGNVYLLCTQLSNLDDLTTIYGSLYYIENKMRQLNSLKYVSGNVKIEDLNLIQLNSLEYVGGDLTLSNSNVISLPNLKHVGGRLDIRYSKIQSLPKLSHIGDSLLINPSYSADFEGWELQSVKQNKIFMPSLSYIGGSYNKEYIESHL